MLLSFCMLASGSGGNCGVVRGREGAVLIDCGIGPRTTARRLLSCGLSLAEIRGICLTHLDSDHFKDSWCGEISRRQIPLYCHEDRAVELKWRIGDHPAAKLLQPFNGADFFPLPKLRCRSLHLAHDEHGSCGFVFEQEEVRIAYASDLGRVTSELVELFCGADILAMESNYDPEMEMASSRPWFLKRRIMGGKGHLSNQEALEAVCNILDRAEQRHGKLPQHIVLLHRSRQCNCPDLLRRLFSSDRRIAPRLTLAEQYAPTIWLDAGDVEARTEQLSLPWGK